MQRLELWQRAKAIIRFPQFQQPTPKKVLPPAKPDRSHSQVVIYSDDMKNNYLHIPDY